VSEKTQGWRDALEEIAFMTYDPWSNGARAGKLAREALHHLSDAQKKEGEAISDAEAHAVLGARAYRNAYDTGWKEALADRHDAQQNTTPPAAAEAPAVPIPTSADQAALMCLLGEQWLRDHAPERLKATPTDSAVNAGAVLSDEQAIAMWDAAATATDEWAESLNMEPTREQCAGHMVRLLLAPKADSSEPRAEPVRMGCSVSIVSSRMCERGMKGCVIQHEDSPASAQVGEAFPETYCLHCEKAGPRTNDCWSTHVVNARSCEIAALSTAQPQADAGVSELRAHLAAIGIVGQIDGHDVIRRLSVLDMADRAVSKGEGK